MISIDPPGYQSGSSHRWVWGCLVSLGVGWVLMVLLMVSDTCRGLGSRMAPDLTRKGFSEIRIGMTEEEVVSLVGQPLEKRLDWRESGSTIWGWTYAKPGLVEMGLDAGVGFRDGRVIRAAASIHDLGVYLCTEEKCPDFLRENGLSCLPER